MLCWVSGTVVTAFFGFCDIRNFTDFTEVLQADVVKVVNGIAEHVHNAVYENFGGLLPFCSLFRACSLGVLVLFLVEAAVESVMLSMMMTATILRMASLSFVLYLLRRECAALLHWLALERK